MRCCAAKALSACGESAGWLKPMLTTLNWRSPNRASSARTDSSSERVVAGQTWKQPV
jgi:hypothetical protein